MSDELKPCPFCGGEAEFDPTRHFTPLGGGAMGQEAVVYCLACTSEIGFCHGDWDGVTDDLYSEVIEWWNTRAPDPALTAAHARIAELEASTAPKVRKLVWDERRNDYWDAKGTAYQVAFSHNGTWRVRLNGKVIFRSRPTFEAAKAAAQSHYDALILGALEPGQDQSARIAELEGVICEFAEVADECDECDLDDSNQAPITAGQCRTARATLAGEDG